MNIFGKWFITAEKLSRTLFALLLIFCTCHNVSTGSPRPTSASSIDVVSTSINSSHVIATIGEVVSTTVSTGTGTKYADNRTFADNLQAFASNGSHDVTTAPPSNVVSPVSDYDTTYIGMDLPRNGSFDFKNGGAVLRAFYVIMGFTLVVVIYFVLRAVRLRRKRNKSHKYGIISTNGDMELTPFDVQDDDDETTVFEVATNHA